MARQCPRGRPGVAEGRLHRDAPGAPHLALPPASTSGVQALEHPQRAQQVPEARRHIRVLGGGRSQAGRPPRSPRGGSRRRFYLVELVEGAEASVSPKVATAEATGAGRRGQVAVVAIRSHRRERESRGRGERLRRVWVGLTDPGPGRLG
jgi:hypothetical protein